MSPPAGHHAYRLSLMPDDQLHEGRVIRVYGGRCVVQTEGGTFDCGLRGKMRLAEEKTVNPVAAGDLVQIAVDTPPNGVIVAVLPRRTKVSRPDVHKPDWEQVLIANCDQLVVVAAVEHPRLSYGAIDRLLLAGERNRLKCLVVLNKIDLLEPAEYQRAHEVYIQAAYPVVLTSAIDGRGVEQLREKLRGMISFLAGHSGVGKSSLVNALEPGLDLRTRAVSYATDRGTHTTTGVQLHPLSFGGYIADSPGLRVIGLWNLSETELPTLYPDFAPYHGQCRFHNCLHLGEPDCAVAAAVQAGQISPERYEGYNRIRLSLREGR